MMENDETLYCVTSPEPKTPEGIYAKAMAEALQTHPEITTAFVATLSDPDKPDEVDLIDPIVEESIPDTDGGASAKAALAELRDLFAAIPASEEA